jgi:hypothetical protein
LKKKIVQELNLKDRILSFCTLQSLVLIIKTSEMKDKYYKLGCVREKRENIVHKENTLEIDPWNGI